MGAILAEIFDTLLQSFNETNIAGEIVVVDNVLNGERKLKHNIQIFGLSINKFLNTKGYVGFIIIASAGVELERLEEIRDERQGVC